MSVYTVSVLGRSKGEQVCSSKLHLRLHGVSTGVEGERRRQMEGAGKNSHATGQGRTHPMTSCLAPRGLSITEQWNTKAPGPDWELWSFHAGNSLPYDQPVFRRGSQAPYLPALPPVRGQGVSLYLLHVPLPPMQIYRGPPQPPLPQGSLATPDPWGWLLLPTKLGFKGSI